MEPITKGPILMGKDVLKGENRIWGDDWPSVRRRWLLDGGVAHCNHGSFGAVPIAALEVQNTFRRRMAENPMAWFHRELPGRVLEARGVLASFLGAAMEDTALVTNVTTGISTILRSLPLGVGDRVVSTNHTYGTVSLALDDLCLRTGATRIVVEIPISANCEEVVAVFEGALSEDTKLVVVDHIASATAKRFPVEKIALVAHSVGAAVLVDGAHAPGMLSVALPELGVDFWVGNMHKWPCAPAGTGVLWVAPSWQERIRPLVIAASDQAGFPTAFDRVGTTDQSAWLAAGTALEIFAELGWEHVRRHNEKMVQWGQATVAERLGVDLDTLWHDDGVSMAVVPLPRGLADTRGKTDALQAWLADRGIEAQVPCWNGLGSVRLSAQVYNAPSDYVKLADALREAASGK